MPVSLSFILKNNLWNKNIWERGKATDWEEDNYYVTSEDESLNELPLEMKSKLSVLFGAMINQIKEQDVIN